MLEKAQEFIRESYQELRKVTWPSRKEILGSTLVVVLAVLFCMLLVWLADLLIQFALNFFLK